MEKRRYTNIKAVEAEIIALRAEGFTRQQIADRLGLEKSQIKNWVYRYNREQKAVPPTDYEREIARLKQENKRLRNVLLTAQSK